MRTPLISGVRNLGTLTGHIFSDSPSGRLLLVAKVNNFLLHGAAEAGWVNAAADQDHGDAVALTASVPQHPHTSRCKTCYVGKLHGRHKCMCAAAHTQVIVKRTTLALLHGRHKWICAAAHAQVIVKRATLAMLHGRHKSICAAAHTQVIVKRTILNDLCRLRLGTL